jgi:pimeloyl-ACP methyl ester carboxylesterase
MALGWQLNTAVHMASPVDLHLREYGRTASGPPLLLLHGLFGASSNWHGIARHLAGRHWVLVPDLRGHGRSPAGNGVSYPAIAADLVQMLDAKNIPQATVVGHSMGGKAAMWLALTTPERVAALAVVDIAPVVYPHRFGDLLAAMRALPLAEITDRRRADALLAPAVPDPAVRGYLLQNLVHRGDGGWRWRIALDALDAAMEQIRGFPEPGPAPFPGPAWFIYGTESGYLTSEHLPRIRQLFPLARLRPVAGAGHWVYSDQPDGFLSALAGILRS